jgi:hypothetical protein
VPVLSSVPYLQAFANVHVFIRSQYLYLMNSDVNWRTLSGTLKVCQSIRRGQGQYLKSAQIKDDLGGPCPLLFLIVVSINMSSFESKYNPIDS